MLTQSCTECRENGWLAQGKHNILPDSQFHTIAMQLQIYNVCYFVYVWKQCGIWASWGKKGEKKASQQISFPQGLSFL